MNTIECKYVLGFAFSPRFSNDRRPCLHSVSCEHVFQQMWHLCSDHIDHSDQVYVVILKNYAEIIIHSW
jgi:hypothetical protein